MCCRGCRDSGRQLALVDQVAGAAPLAEALAGTLRALGEVRAQLATIAELGGEQEMEALQRLVDEVGRGWLNSSMRQSVVQ